MLPTSPARAGDDYITRLGVLAPSAWNAWQEPGFRLQLLAGYDRLGKAEVLPGGGGFVFSVMPSVRMSSWWSLDVAFRYAVSATEQLAGLHWTALLGATLHPLPGLNVALGLGYAGTSLASANEVSVYQCNGAGGAVQARVGYLLPVFESFATGPVLQAEINGVQCGDVGDGTHPFLWLPSFTLAWSVAWR